MTTPLIVAHRGGKALGPENTLATIKKSIAAGAQAIEIDVQCAFHNEVMVIHDPTLDRTTNRSGEVAKLSQQEIQACDAGDGEHVPSLIGLLNELATENVQIFVDLKHPRVALPAAKIVDHFLAQKGYMRGQIIIISQLHQLIALVHSNYPKLITGAGMSHAYDSLAACGEYTHSYYLIPNIDLLDESLMEDANKRKLKVIPWVCDTKEQINRAKKFGVEGIMTSDPTLLTKR